MKDFKFGLHTAQQLLLTNESVFVIGQHRNSFGNWYTVLRVIDGHQVEDDLPEEAFANPPEPARAFAAGGNLPLQSADVIQFPAHKRAPEEVRVFH